MIIEQALIQKKKRDWLLKRAAETYNPGMPDWAIQELQRREQSPAAIDNPPPKSTFYQDLALTTGAYGGAGYGAHQLRKRILGKELVGNDKKETWVYDNIRKRQADARKSIDNLQNYLERDPELAAAMKSDEVKKLLTDSAETGARVQRKPFVDEYLGAINKVRYAQADAVAKATNKPIDYKPRVEDTEFTNRFKKYQDAVSDMKNLETSHPVASRRLRDFFKKQEYGMTDISKTKQISDSFGKRLSQAASVIGPKIEKLRKLFHI